MTKECSEQVEQYFETIENEVKQIYKICNEARNKKIDPEETVAIPLAKDMTERVEGLISVVEPNIKDSGISNRIKELEKEHGKLSWKVAFIIALETAQEKFCSFDSKLRAMEIGIRVGLAYLTLGVVASPLEGFVELKLKKRRDGKEYFCLMFSGPIRSAGGTAAAVLVLIADYIRNQMGYSEYDATDNEVKRASTELYDYHERITNLQYLPSEEEIEFLVKNIPIQVDGDPSEKIDVSNYKDLPRIETNRIRSGFCLVIGECLCQKAQKLVKQLSDWGQEFNLQDWAFLKEFVKLQKKKKAKKIKSDSKIQPDFTYIKDLVAGRPILSFPLRSGGFRLRYGRSRNTGLSSCAINPALTFILDNFIAVGTQIKMERPGKASSLSMCDTIEGPLVRLKDESVIRVNDVNHAKAIAKDVDEIIYLGDLLISYGDFFNRAHTLVPAGYCEEWWIQEIRKYKFNIEEKRLVEITQEKHDSSITAEEALLLAKKVPLHPKYNFYWNTLSQKEALSLFNWLEKSKIFEKKIVLQYLEREKRLLELLGVPHISIGKEHVVIEGDNAQIVTYFIDEWKKSSKEFSNNKTTLESLNEIFSIKQRDRCGTFIGARMGRPEKAKVRKMDGQPHCLFPIGEEGGRLRSFQSAIEKGKVTSDFPINICECGNETPLYICEKCNSITNRLYFCKICGIMEKENCSKHGKNQNYRKTQIDITHMFECTLKNLGLKAYPDLIKGVRGTSNKDHIPEHLAKGILRAKYSVPVNKDGTTRYDMTQLAITHFTPKEIGTDINELREMGYVKDIYGEELTRKTQIIEMFAQDLILRACEDSSEDGSDKILHNVSLFIDEMLEKLYGLKPYYNLKDKKDLRGHLVIALAPHTSAGIVGRIIGFSKTQGFYAHPLFHAATRRDCDGDEASVTLLADALLNFSRKYLPNTRGATQDAPLVLTSKLTPAEVDDMVFDMDVAGKYPLSFYEASQDYKKPWNIKIDQINKRLNTEKQFEDMSFTHNTSNINLGAKCSNYKLLPSMQDKLHGQMNLALKIRAVDESEVARIVIDKHFIKDIRGNLRKFSQQQFRCVDCNSKYRRPPLIGKCTKCEGKLLFTVSEGSIVKYLGPALSLAEHYNLPSYMKQSLDLIKKRVESIFGKDKEYQEGLGKWFG